MTNLAQLQWLCRRGIKEMDLLLENYLNCDFVAASKEEQEEFIALLNLDDATLMSYIFSPELPDSVRNYQRILEKLRSS